MSATTIVLAVVILASLLMRKNTDIKAALAAILMFSVAFYVTIAGIIAYAVTDGRYTGLLWAGFAALIASIVFGFIARHFGRRSRTL